DSRRDARGRLSTAAGSGRAAHRTVGGAVESRSHRRRRARPLSRSRWAPEARQHGPRDQPRGGDDDRRVGGPGGSPAVGPGRAAELGWVGVVTVFHSERGLEGTYQGAEGDLVGSREAPRGNE